jgi:hypothetical protein
MVRTTRRTTMKMMKMKKMKNWTTNSMTTKTRNLSCS